MCSGEAISPCPITRPHVDVIAQYQLVTANGYKSFILAHFSFLANSKHEMRIQFWHSQFEYIHYWKLDLLGRDEKSSNLLRKFPQFLRSPRRNPEASTSSSEGLLVGHRFQHKVFQFID